VAPHTLTARTPAIPSLVPAWHFHTRCALLASWLATRGSGACAAQPRATCTTLYDEQKASSGQQRAHYQASMLSGRKLAGGGRTGGDGGAIRVS